MQKGGGFADFMAKMFIKNYQNIESPKVRRNYGYLGSIYGLVTNILMFTLKIIFANVYNISSMQADALNNASDIGMCFLALIAVYIVSRPATSKHPYGSARFEYLGSFVIAMLVIILAISQMSGAIQDAALVRPGENIFGWNQIELWLPFGIMIGAGFIKLTQVLLLISLGKKIGSMTLIATGKDARNDSMVAFMIGLSYLISPAIRYDIDPILTACVSLLIAFSGFGIIKDSSDALMGANPDVSVIKKFYDTIMSYPVILGVHDLEMHTYGQNEIRAYIHAEVDASTPSMVIRDEIDNVEKDIEKKTGIRTLIHIDPIVIGDAETDRFKAYVIQACREIDQSIYINDFRLVKNISDLTSKKLVFDLVLPFDLLKDDKKVITQLKKTVKSFTSDNLSFDIDVDDQSSDLLTLLSEKNYSSPN